MLESTGKTGAVAAPDPIAAAAGAQVLRDGGNAADAAVAAALVDCVVQPHNVGLGGYSGSAVVCSPEGSVTALDFGGSAPIAATPDMFADLACTDNWDINRPDNGPGLNERGGLAVTAPAVVAGLAALLETQGTLSFARAAGPAQAAAEEGFEVGAGVAAALSKFVDWADPGSVLAVLPSGRAPRAGERLVQPDLGALIAKLRAEGPQSMYAGETAEAVVARVRELGGILATDDFAAVRARIEAPLSIACGDCGIYTPAPPSAGLTSLQVVNALEISGAEFGSAQWYLDAIRAAVHAWDDRRRYMGDPDFVDVPIEQLLSMNRADELLADGYESTVPSGETTDGGHTVHISAVDGNRMLVSVTLTHGNWFGSMVAVPGLGLILGHGMSRFEVVPGRANSIAPGKRIQHNMSPLMITRSGRPFCAIGLPGGRKIPSVATLFAHALARGGLNCAQAIAAPRFSVEWSKAPVVDSAPLLEDLLRIDPNCGVQLSAGRIAGPATAVEVAPDGATVLAASQAGPDCVAVV